ncbi:MAG: hypothetical protein QM774_12045 [Gordonia sp. (in: high G+C Gram-positive bacteria)]|uniref:hypothetical protein n=1 Tax=Gordonia sp. (in: high G+C Gram-positive bacteria) TaxID=84139 RepID=UPI0039E44CF1
MGESFGVLVVAGRTGPGRDELAHAVTGRARIGTRVVIGPGESPPGDMTHGLLLFDPAHPVGAAEHELLAALRGSGRPVALVAVPADTHPDRTRAIAAARRILDPDWAVPAFAVSVAAGDPQTSGLADLVAWCADPAAPREHPGTVARQRAQRALDAKTGYAGLRAGIAADLRHGARELTRIAEDACTHLRSRDTATLRSWLGGELDRYTRAVAAAVDAGTDQIAWTATRPALPPTRPMRPPPATVTAVTGRREITGEDLVVLLLGVSAGLGLGRIAVAPLLHWAGLGAVGTVLTVVAGFVLAATVAGTRRVTALRSQARRHCIEAIAAHRQNLEHAVAAHLAATEAALVRVSMEPNGPGARPTL